MRTTLRLALVVFALLLAGPALAQWKRAAPVLDRPPMLLNGEVGLQFWVGKPGLLSTQTPISGLAFGPGRDEVAFCAPTKTGRSGLWVVPAAFPAANPVSFPHDPREPITLTQEEHLVYRFPKAPARLLWSAPEGRTLAGPVWWSADGARILVRELSGEQADLVAVDYLGGKAVRFSEHARVAEAAWSPNSARIAYTIDDRREGGVWLQSVPPGQPKRLGAGGSDLRWSVDGKTLRWNAPAGDSSTVQMEWNGERAEPAGQLATRPAGAIWSPDGQLCAALEGAPKQLVIYARNSSAGETVPLPGLDPRRLLGWSPDSRLVLVVGQGDQPVAVSARREAEVRDDIKRALSLGTLTYSDVRAAVIGPPMDPDSPPPAWSSKGDLVSYVWASEKPEGLVRWSLRGASHVEEMLESMREHGWLPATNRALICLSVARQYLPQAQVLAAVERAEAEKAQSPAEGPPQGEVLKARLLSNVKNITLALNMYMADFDAFPPTATTQDLRKTINDYVKNDEVWLLPGSQEVIVRYLLPPGLKGTDIADPAVLPVVAIDNLPDCDLVGFADGHVKEYPKGSDWGQGSGPGE